MLRNPFLLALIMLITRTAMADQSDYLSKLENVEKLISGSNHSVACDLVFADIKKRTGRTIPDLACNITYSSRILTEEYSGVFLGFSALSLDELKYTYKNVNASDSFFYPYKIDDNFNVAEDRSIVIEEYKEKSRPDADIKNLSGILPLFRFQGDFIVINLDAESFGELLIISHGHLANILAPNLSAHILDLMEGLESGIYMERDGDLIYPPVWEDRQALREGRLVMDKYGEVSAP